MFLKIRRLLAVAVDFYIIFQIIYWPLYCIFKNLDNMIANIFCGLISIILFINLMLRKDCIIGYESIGKKIFKLKIFHNKQAVKNEELLIDRTLITMGSFALYPFMVLYNNKSKGDIKCNTEIKSFRKK